MVSYLKVQWHHSFPEEPIELYSEVDDEGYETRKVQLFRDGRLERADTNTETAMTGLSEIPIGPVEEIASHRVEFEEVWSRPEITG
jgi:hypothetical protein